MKIINHLLVPTDFTACAENAYRYALQLAWKWQSSIKLLHIVEPDYGVADLPVLVDVATKDKVEVATELLNTFQENGLAWAKQELLTLPNVSAEIKVSGLPYSAISEVAKDGNFDLILMGTNDYHSAWENAFGTNSTAVMGKADCHVMIVPEHSQFQRFTNVGFAADLHATDPYHLWKFCKLMEPFHPVVHCSHIEKKGSQEKTAMRIEELKAFFANNSIALQIQFHTIEEESVETGVEFFVEKWSLDLLAVSSQHRDGLGSVFHKSVTRQLALHAKVPLLVMHWV